MDKQVISDDRYLSLMAKDQFLRELRWMERLSSEEAARLLSALAAGKKERAKVCSDAGVLAQAQEARNRLIVEHQFLVLSIVRRLLPSFRLLDELDLVNEVNAMLLVRLDEYCDNPAWAGCPFSHFVSSMTYKALFQALRERDRAVCLPQKVTTLLNKKRCLERDQQMVGGRDLSVQALCQSLEVGHVQV